MAAEFHSDVQFLPALHDDECRTFEDHRTMPAGQAIEFGAARGMEVPFLSISGEMADRVREFPWHQTSIGPISDWPQSLKTAVGIVLLSPVPMVMLWGEDGVMIYNDAYSVFAGGRHPELLGSKVREGWPEVADFNDNVMRVGLAGGTLAYRDQQLTLSRSGQPEPVWMNLDYSPIPDESGRPAGVLAIVIETTERVRAEAALRRSEEQLRLATEAAEVGLWDVDNVNDLLFWPARVKAMFGISPDVPVSMADFYAGLHPEDRDATSAAYAAACHPARRAVYDVEYRTIGKEDGVIRWVAAKGRAVFDRSGNCVRVIGTAIDITTRKEIEERLLELNETLERQVEERTAERDRVWRHSRDLLLVVGADGIIRAANPAWTEILGYAPEELVGRGLVDFVAPEDATLTSKGLATAISKHDLTNFESRYRHKDGSTRWISWHTSREYDLVFGYGRDVTDSKAKEAALAEAEAALRQAQKMEAIGQLTGGIAHDFNNLLQSVSGNLDLIRRRPDEPERVHLWAEAAFKGAQRGAKLTGQLLAFSRSQKLELKPINLSALLSAMRDLLGRSLGPSIRITIGLEAQAASVLCDETQLEMAILNLAINSRDAMPDGGDLRITTHERMIADDPELAAGSYIELAISDTGTGMSTEVASKAFEPFFTTKGVGKGTGLGLSQVYGMARQAGGIARIHSVPSQGTTISLFLRRIDTRSLGETRDNRDCALDSVPATILIIDDDLDVRKALREMLNSLGYNVLEAADGTSGLKMLARTPADLAIIDYAMPGLTGAEVAREARRHRPSLPIIVASGYSETAAIEKILDANTSVLRKPFELACLQDALLKLLRAKSKEAV